MRGKSILVALIIAPFFFQGCLEDSSMSSRGDFELRLVDTDRRDRVFEVEVIGAPRGEEITFAFTEERSNTRACPMELEPRCLALSEPLEIVTVNRVDSDGEAWAYIPFPRSGQSTSVHVQAWTTGASAQVSDALMLEAD